MLAIPQGPKSLNGVTMATVITTQIHNIPSHEAQNPLTANDHQPTKLPANTFL
jgi:hypothetical protein